MDLREVVFSNQMPVDAYGPGFFRVDDQVHEGGLVLSEDGVVAWDGLGALGPVTALAGKIDVLFVGMGADIAPFPADLREQLFELAIAVEPMSTPSACRTYNVLLSEGRRVALAALPV